MKGKFFDVAELFWAAEGTLDGRVVCRLTPEKYHYNHNPVAGIVRDFYKTDGDYHSCNPGAVITLASSYSKNKRAVAVIDTDVGQGAGIGLVALVEVVALMIGDIVRCYSRHMYKDPAPMKKINHDRI